METHSLLQKNGILSNPTPISISVGRIKELAMLKAENSHVWVDPHFYEIVDQATSLPPEHLEVCAHDVTQMAFSDEIKSALKDGWRFEATPFCYMLAHELRNVLEGRDSEVLLREGWCLFYVEGQEVFIRWNSGSQMWSICVWKYQGRSKWNINNRVFAPRSIQ